ncbi:Mitogen-activated protein kinase 3 [Hondaea fermentalgiana]|uniref:Mitogen-activated protein kinase 3 n=1 Tax=Hondaea fermentalgiana TaxID=2315210 RepID=A0A2R5G1G9_9STRA|nr:Mitogen-activated protein kinase 3 [Hondaea fermentalgiana]|eukprot:GBG24850.1 Mitogen-activated protein kinase 3 [Hondaea fermentalgiana]
MAHQDQRRASSRQRSSNKQQTKSTSVAMMTEYDYKVLDKIGEGAYGVVYSAQDRRTGKLVAIKKIAGAMDRTNSCKRTFRELKFLTTLQHENVIPLQHIICPTDVAHEAVARAMAEYYGTSASGEEVESKAGEESKASSSVMTGPPAPKSTSTTLYVVLDLMETDLTSIIKSPQHLTNEHCQFFLYQVLRGLKYIHSANIIHRDLKPRNLLVNSNCDLRICDFGLARLDLPELSRKDGACMSDYVATRWYRPPEVVCESGTYTKALDMWAAGCILVELLLRKPIFPGADQYDLLKRICEVLGPPPESTIRSARSQKLQIYLRNLSYQYPKPLRPLSRLLQGCCPKAVDLASRLLVFEPERRLTVEEAIRHPYLASLYCPRDEPTRESIQDPDFAFETQRNVQVQDLRCILLRHAAKYSRKSRTELELELELEEQQQAEYDEAKSGLESGALKSQYGQQQQQQQQQVRRERRQQQQQQQDAEEDEATEEAQARSASTSGGSSSSTSAGADEDEDDGGDGPEEDGEEEESKVREASAADASRGAHSQSKAAAAANGKDEKRSPTSGMLRSPTSGMQALVDDFRALGGHAGGAR